MILRTIALVALAARVAAAQSNSLLPVPRSITTGSGRFHVDSTTRVAITKHRDLRLERAASRFVTRLSKRIAQPLTRDFAIAPVPNAIELRVDSAARTVQALGDDESYRVTIDGSRAVLSARTTLGAIRGLETLLQLVVGDRTSFYLPEVAVDDAPRFPWRGLLVDASRHFMPVDQIKRTLDGMSMVKLNVLHWHLSDDQGFRIESERFPRLHQLGSDGDFYTQSEVRDVVSYASDRGIRVIPEFDMPGHTTAWFVGYPQYTAQPSPVKIRRDWGGADAIFDPTREATYTFIARFIGEIAPLFPDAFWHVGGDEVEGKHWNTPAIIAWRKKHGMKDNDALQAYFNRRVTKILTSLGKRMVGWDEILHPDLPAGTVVQSWRGTQYLSDGAKRGFTGILSAPWYLDHINPASSFYLADPVPQFDELTPQQRALIIGGEACMWAEYITPDNADSRIWPRLGAVAERLWSPRETTNVDDMYRRLDILADRLEGAGLRVESFSSRYLAKLAPGIDIAPLESLFTAVQPPPFGQTENGKLLDQTHPLSRVVDASRPDPRGRWLTERLVRRMVVNRGDAAARDSLTLLLKAWSALQPKIRALGEQSPILQQTVPAADALARVSAIGLEAIGYLASNSPPPADWGAPRTAELRTLEGPFGSLRIAIAPEIAKLVAAVGQR